MTKKLELYKCNICGNIVEVVIEGAGELVCCGQPMKKMQEQTTQDETLQEKHVPILKTLDDGVEIRVGSIPHPMMEEHYIQFIEAYSEDKKYVKRKYLSPNEEPVLKLKCNCSDTIARELCNIHGLWISDNRREKND